MMNQFNLALYLHINIEHCTYIEHIKYGKWKLKVLVAWTFQQMEICFLLKNTLICVSKMIWSILSLGRIIDDKCLLFGDFSL